MTLHSLDPVTLIGSNGTQTVKLGVSVGEGMQAHCLAGQSTEDGLGPDAKNYGCRSAD